MKKLTNTVNTVVVFSMLMFLAAKTAVTARFEKIDNDRGDIPGWAIASAAACVFGAAVWIAFGGVITKYIGKIH